MAYPREHGFYTHGVLRLVLVMVGVFLAGYILGPPLYWRLKESPTAQASCPSCVCDCSSEIAHSLPLGLLNSSYADCGKHDPDMNEEMEKDIVALLLEELTLHRIVANGTLEHIRALIMDAKKVSSQYQKEAEKCSAGTETCEEARERAEAELTEEHKLSALWEKRAHELGWKDN